jgi:hypothetical protein
VSIVLDVTEVSAVVAAAGVLVGVVYYILDMRNQARTRQTDLVMRLYSTYGSKDFQEAWATVRELDFKDYNDFVKKYGWSAAMSEVCLFFEGVGVLLHKKLVDISMLDDLFTGPVKMTWEKMKPMIEGHREQRKYPQFYEWLEYLYNEMKKREQKLQQEGVNSG